MKSVPRVFRGSIMGRTALVANNLLAGIIAGAAGTTALNAVTYGDMVLRGRPASEAPTKVAAIFADKAGVDLTSGDHSKDGQQVAESRQQGLGSLIGYVAGVGVGAALAPLLGKLPTPLLGITLGIAAMAASDAPIAALGVSNPAEWSASDWVSDLIPHLVYGLVTAAVYEALRDH